ncbi:hypothetical protein OAK03_04475 [Gammaproteobacteria bacterium]|nr:hypothetical protein [Gammaproteobacteria bacterium]
MKVESTAPGKIFLSGEYFVLDGSLATIMSTKQRVKVTIADQIDVDNIFYCSVIDQCFQFNVNNSYQVNWLDEDPGEFGLFLELSITYMRVKPTNTFFAIDSDDLYFQGTKIGLGSSAAISVAVLNAINNFYGLKLSENDLIHNSMELHKLHQGKNGSGLDIISSHADSNLIECSKNMLSKYKWNALDWPKNLIIKGVITSQQSSTSSMIEKYNIAKQDNSQNFKSLYSKMTQILKEFSEAWHQGNSSDILNLLKQQNILIKQLDHDFDLGIYTQEHNKILDLAESIDLFYKPSGAGGGDLGIIISDDALKIKKFSKKLSNMNHYVINLRK